MIYQGANSPIRIRISGSVSDVTNMSVLLHDGNSDVKNWEYNDLTISDEKIFAPLTEADTMEFPVGMLTLEIKWSDGNGIVHIEPTKLVKVIKRLDTAVISTVASNETDSQSDDGTDPSTDQGDDSETSSETDPENDG